jgi:tetratricopeptide (TPR) repeat protein
MACIEIYEALLVENNIPEGVDSFVPSFPLGCSSEGRRPRTRRHHVLIHFAIALRERYSHIGHRSDLDAAIAQGQAALSLCRAESMICPTVLVIHAGHLQNNYGRTGDYDELRMAEMMCREALALCATGSTLSAAAYHTLSWIIFRLYQSVGTPAYLDEALDLQRWVLNLKSASHYTEGMLYLRAIAVYTLERHIHRGNPQDIDDAMSFLEQALELCPVIHVNRMLIVQCMMYVAQRKHDLSGRLEDLNKAIDLGRQNIATLIITRGDRRLSFLNALANLLIARYEFASSIDYDLEESVNLRREAFQCVSPSSTLRWLFAGNLADSLILRFMRKGEWQDLEESIELRRHAIDLLPNTHPKRPKMFARLHEALCHRFHETRDAADLDEALVSGRCAMAATPSAQTDYWEVSLATISHLCTRFEVIQAIDDLDQAILLSEGLLKVISDGHLLKGGVIYHLAKALLLRSAHLNAREDVDRVIRELLPFRKQFAQWAAAPELLRTFATSYLVRFRLNQDLRDAAHALDITNDLLDVVGPSHYERFQCLVHAAEIYSERGTPFRDNGIALKHMSDAMLNNCRDVRSKIQGAKIFLDTVKKQYTDDWTAASPEISMQLLNLYISAISLLPRVAFFGLHLHSRLQSLAMGQSITLDGASHALNISLPERALEILEQGRVIFWNHTLRLRSTFDHVSDEFRNQLTYLARQLEKSSYSLRAAQDSQTIEKEAAQRRQQSEEFNSLVDRIRCLPGMERFLLHDEYATLAKAADRGPVVVLVSSALACHATIVKSVEEIISIPLDSMTELSLDESGDIWRTEVIRARSAVRDTRKMVKMSTPSRFTSTRADDILERLWAFVVYPVLNKLGLQVCCFLRPITLAIELKHDSDSRPLAVIDPESGGVQQAALPIFHFMQQVPTANDARITSFRLTHPRSELF